MISPQNGANAAPSRRLQHNPEVERQHINTCGDAQMQEEAGLALSCPFLVLLAEMRREGKASLLRIGS